MKFFQCLFLALVMCLHCAAQQHVSEILSLDTTIELEYYTHLVRQREITGAVCEGNLFFCRNSVTHNDSFNLRIFCVNLTGLQQSFFDLRIPDFCMVNKMGINPSTLWINGIAVADSQIAVITQKMVLFYTLRLNNYTFTHYNVLHGAVGGYFHQGIFYVLEFENHEKYTLSKVDALHKKKIRIRDFCFDSPFILQFTPHRHLVVGTDGIYHLKTNHIGYAKYSFNGESLYSVQGDSTLPWYAISPDDNIRIMKLPYGTDRIFEALPVIREHSYCTKIFPFDNGRSLIAFHNFDTTMQIETYNLAYACYDTLSQKLHLTPYLFDYVEDIRLSKERYPFYLYKSEIVYSTTYKDKFIQIIQGVPFNWNNLIVKQYKDSVNQYFSTNEPIMQLRIMTLRGGRVEKAKEKDNCIMNFKFKDYNGKIVDLESLANSKLILIVNNGLQCSSCERSLYEYFDRILCDTIWKGEYVFAIAFPEMNSYLMKREKTNGVSKYCKQRFTPLYFTDPVLSGSEVKNRLHSDYPKVLLFDKRKSFERIFKSSDLFSDNIYQNIIDDNFNEFLLQFLKE